MSCTSLKFFLKVYFKRISPPPLLQRLDKTLICFTSQEVGFFFKVTHSQLVTGWELPRIPLLAHVHLLWPLDDPGQPRLLICSEGTPSFSVLALGNPL